MCLRAERSETCVKMGLAVVVQNDDGDERCHTEDRGSGKSPVSSMLTVSHADTNRRIARVMDRLNGAPLLAPRDLPVMGDVNGTAPRRVPQCGRADPSRVNTGPQRPLPFPAPLDGKVTRGQ